MTDPESALAEWMTAWEVLDVDAIVKLCNVPMVLIRPEGVLPLADEAAIRGLMAAIVTERRAEAYARTDFVDRTVAVLADTVVTLSGTEIAFNTNGDELRRVGMMYTVIAPADQWRIAAVTTYPQRAG